MHQFFCTAPQPIVTKISGMISGIYGSMVHTRYFADETHAHNEFDAMKNALARIVEQPRPDGSAADPIADLTEFVKRYP